MRATLHIIETIADGHKLVIENIQPEIRDFCSKRFEKWPDSPCGRCRYRDDFTPREKGDPWGCIFESCPSDWGFE